MPSFSRHSGSTAARDENRDGRIDERDERPVADTEPVRVREQTDDRTVYRSRTADETPPVRPGDSPRHTAADAPTERIDADRTVPDVRRADDDARRADADADRATEQRVAAERAAERADAHDADRTTAPAGPRPRASLFATLSLITGVAAALFVLSGALAGYGVGLAVLALLLAVGGISATGRRHVAGKTDALIGLVLALGALVVGILALTGSLSWLGTDTDTVNRFREWLDTQFVDRF